MYTPIDLDKPRRLRFDIQACEDLETILDMSMGEIVRRLNTVSVRTTRFALWAGLKHEDPQLTLESTRDLLQAHCDNGGKYQDVSDAVATAIADSTPFHNAGKKGNARPKAATKTAS